MASTIANDGIAFYAGAEQSITPETAKFIVHNNGNLTASNARIEGIISSSEGNIGG